MQNNDHKPLAVLWDMDGVLIDTSPHHFIAWQEVLSEFGVKLDWENFQAAFGLKNNLIIEKFLKRGDDQSFVEAMEARKETRFRQLIAGKATLLPGVLKWLEKLKSLKLLQAVASSAPLENIELLIRETGIRPYFSAIVSADGLPGKPDPSIFIKAASLLHIDVERCVVFEDAVFGIQAARRAGMKCVAIANSLPEKELAQADLVVSRLENLTEEAFFNLHRN